MAAFLRNSSFDLSDAYSYSRQPASLEEAGFIWIGLNAGDSKLQVLLFSCIVTLV